MYDLPKLQPRVPYHDPKLGTFPVRKPPSFQNLVTYSFCIGLGMMPVPYSRTHSP